MLNLKIVSPMIIIFIVSNILAACTPELRPQSPGDVDFGIDEQGYPADEGYPLSNRNYPYPIEDSSPNSGLVFSIDEPIFNDQTNITGTGPSGVPIILIDIFEIDSVLSETIVGDDGSFLFVLKKPIKSGHSVGIKLGDISGTPYSDEDFTNSDTYYDRPFIGLLLDIAHVE